MSIKLGIIGYVPRPQLGNSPAFMANIRQFKTRTPMVLYSDYDWPDTVRIKDPEVVKDQVGPDGKPNKFAIPNAIFFTGLRIARQEGFTHIITLEVDSRVGCDYWDEIMWEEFFGIGRPLIAAGTLATYNPDNWSPEASRRWRELIQRNSRKNFPVVTYGWLGAGKKGQTLVFPNGALAIYDMAWMQKLFTLDEVLKWSSQATAWDFETGIRIWNHFQEHSYDVVGMMESIWSGYGDIVTTEEQRREMLTSGKVCAVHQIKSSWQP